MDGTSAFITVIGDVGVDLVMGTLAQWPQIGTELIMSRSELRAGGSAGNAALALRHLGVPAQLLSAVGDDHFGRWLDTQFEGLDRRLAVCPGATTLSVGLMHRCSERNFFTTEGHLAQLHLAQLLPGLPARVPAGSLALLSGVFLLPRLRADYPALLAELQARGYQIALDTGWPSEGWTAQVRSEVRGWLASCDHLLLNELEVCSLADCSELPEAMARLQACLKPGARLIVKAGARGALALQGESRHEQAAEVAPVFDTIGAGDAFNAGYLAATLRGQPLPQALARACQVAAAVLTRFPRGGIAAGEFGHLLALAA